MSGIVTAIIGHFPEIVIDWREVNSGGSRDTCRDTGDAVQKDRLQRTFGVKCVDRTFFIGCEQHFGVPSFLHVQRPGRQAREGD